MNTNNENKSFADSLSTRSKNGLSRCFGRDKLNNPEIIAEAGMGRLKFAVMLGTKSLREIAGVLNKFGYIEDIDQWLEG